MKNELRNKKQPFWCFFGLFQAIPKKILFSYSRPFALSRKIKKKLLLLISHHAVLKNSWKIFEPLMAWKKCCRKDYWFWKLLNLIFATFFSFTHNASLNTLLTTPGISQRKNFLTQELRSRLFNLFYFNSKI